MPGLNKFRNGVAAPTAPTTYTASYATTAQDAKDKCQGNVVASVTRTATSTDSFVDALTKATAAAKLAIVCPVFTSSYTTTDADSQAACQGNLATKVTKTATSGKDQPTADAAAKALALAAIVCPVFYGSYTTTQQDFTSKCGNVVGYTAITRSTTSGKDQPTADAAAKALALAAITCPAPFPNYNTTLSLNVPNDPAGEVTLTLGAAYQDGVFKFNASPGGDSTGKSMIVNIGGAFACLLDFPATYTNATTGWTFEAGGHRYYGNYVDGTVEATKYS